ncbi:hypothetical protein MYCO108962_26400 [Mycobacterium colombiense]
MGARARDGQPIRPHRDHDVCGDDRAADRGPRFGADRLAGSRRRAVRAGSLAASGAARRGGGAVHRGAGRRHRLSRPGRPDGIAVRRLPVRRLRRAHVPHRGPGALGRGRAAGLSRARGRTDQDPRLPHRAGRDTLCAHRIGGHRAGRGHRPRGPSGRRAAGGVCHRDGRPVRGAVATRRTVAALHGAGRRRDARRTAADGQRQARHPRPARPGLRHQRISGPGRRDRRDPGRHLRPSPRPRAGRHRRFVLRPGRGQHLVDAGGGPRPRRRRNVPAARCFRRADGGPVGPGRHADDRRRRRGRRRGRAGAGHPHHALAAGHGRSDRAVQPDHGAVGPSGGGPGRRAGRAAGAAGSASHAAALRRRRRSRRVVA